MRLVGYSDKLSVERGSDVAFMVSSEASTYGARVVRLIHGDENPAGPGFKSHEVPSAIEGTYEGRAQQLRAGSYVRVPHDQRLEPAGSFSIHMWIWPTTPTKETQTLVAKAAPGGAGYALRLQNGGLTLQVGEHAVELACAVAARTWYSVACVYDAEAGAARLALDPVEPTAWSLAGSCEAPIAAGELASAADLLIAAEALRDEVGNVYNGKIEAPCLFDRALGDADLGALRSFAGAPPTNPIAAWDFSADISSWHVTDASGSGLHGVAVNKPMRAATGHAWDGSETAWRHAPEQYGAIHFHDDDLADAGWEQSFRWTVPDDLPSGIYAVQLQAGDDEDFLPFVVRPRRGERTAKIALLVPTFSYLAYANQHGFERPGYPSQPQDRYMLANPLHSLYDRHNDGTGVCHSSRLRPIASLRPKYVNPVLNAGRGGAHQFNADLHLVDWLHERGYDVDMFGDEDLHHEGRSILDGYNVILTGTHHEYWSEQMIDATQEYLLAGGRLMYLAGNGMYWVTQLDPTDGTSIEVRRRGPSTRAWEPEPGEAHHSTTGELGGLWRYRGRSPQSWVGVGFTGQGLSEGRPYERQAGSFDPRAAFVFEGVGENESIGDFPNLIDGYGAAGFELDRVDPALGTPHHTIVLATASGFSDDYLHATEETLIPEPPHGGPTDPLVKADLVLLEYPAGGAVFTPGSIAWCGSLSYNGYDNNVSTITANVLDRFAADGPVFA